MKINDELLSTPGPGHYYIAARDTTFKKATEVRDRLFEIPPSVRVLPLPPRPLHSDNLGPGSYEPFTSVFDVELCDNRSR